MADTTISSSSKKNTCDWDEAPIPYAPPPPKTGATTKTSTTPASPPPAPPPAVSGYDAADAAKHMPVTTLAKSGPPGPMELSLDALKSRRDAIQTRLAAPKDYPERKADEARLVDVQAQINEREAQLQRMNGPTPKGKVIVDEPVLAGSNPANGESRLTIVGGDEDRVRIGYADATTHPSRLPGGGQGQAVDQVSVGVLKYQNQVTTPNGGTSTTTVVVGSANLQTGPINPDGSRGVGVGAGVTAVGGEHTWARPDGGSVTLGAGVSNSVGMSAGKKVMPNGGEAVCARVEAGPVTLGGCAPTTKGADET
jgi:hypothetical protein